LFYSSLSDCIVCYKEIIYFKSQYTWNNTLEDYLKHNKIAWNKQVGQKNKWTLPVSPHTISDARSGKWQVVLTPWKPVPVNWFPPLTGINLLCLASGGGQQAPIFAAAGANVTVLDIAENQLEQDRKVARRDGLHIETVEGEMTNLSMFEDAHFDVIFHPVSNCFIEDVKPLWREAYRVLKPSGRLLSGMANPVLFLFDVEAMEKNQPLIVKHKIPYSDLESLTEKQKTVNEQEGHPFEFGHSLEDLIGEQLKTGFTLKGFFEDKHNHKDEQLYEYFPTYFATYAVKQG